jgi:hypothetical protein
MTCAGFVSHHFGDTNAIVSPSRQTMSSWRLKSVSSPAASLQNGQS